MSYRDLRLLQAVADGRIECTGSAEPDFFVDGVAYCDHMAARALVRSGLIHPAGDAGDDPRLPVQLTTAGRDALLAVTATDPGMQATPPVLLGRSRSALTT
jgi:hypothetical protein